MRKIPFGTITITESAITRINSSLAEKRVSGGKYVHEFEDKFATYIGTKHAVAVSSGTDALTLALSVLSEKNNNEDLWNTDIILPALTFIATANAVVNAGFNPLFVDIDRYTLTMDYDDLLDGGEKFKNVAGIIPVHLMGNPVDMDYLKDIIKPHGLMIIEDAAEAHGTSFNGKKVGSIGDMGCFSTYLAHIISTIDGGVITTDSDEYAKILRSLRMHGRNCSCKQCVINTVGSKCEKRFKGGVDQRFLFNRVGYSSRMNDLEAAVGLGCLENIEDIISKRKRNYFHLDTSLNYLSKFKDFFYTMILSVQHVEEFSPHAFPIICNENIPFHREDFACYLEENGIETRTLFASIPSQYKAYEYLGHKLGDFPNAEYVGNNGIHIGCHQDITSEDCFYIVGVIQKFMEKF